MSAPLRNLQHHFEPVTFVPVPPNRQPEPEHLNCKTAAFDLGTEEGRFALGQWAANQILAAVHAPVERRR